MKLRAFVFSVLCLVSIPARAQGWVQADTSGVSFGDTLLAHINTLPNPDTAWMWPLAWTANTHLLKWERPHIAIGGDPWFWTGSYGFIRAGRDTIFRTTDAGWTWKTFQTGHTRNAI